MGVHNILVFKNLVQLLLGTPNKNSKFTHSKSLDLCKIGQRMHPICEMELVQLLSIKYFSRGVKSGFSINPFICSNLVSFFWNQPNIVNTHVVKESSVRTLNMYLTPR